MVLATPFVVVDAPVLVRFPCCYGGTSPASQIVIKKKQNLCAAPVAMQADVSLTSQPVFSASTRRLSLRRTKDGIQDHLPRVVEERGSLVIKKKSLGSCVHKLSCSVSSKEWRRAGRRRESWRGEVEEETDCKKKLDEQKEKPAETVARYDMEPMFRDRQIEKWKEELQEIERKRTELLLEHQRVQKRSRKTAEFAGQEEQGRLCVFMTALVHCVGKKGKMEDDALL